MAAEQGEHRVVKDMTISHAEFFRIGQRVVDGERHEVHSDGMTIYRGHGTVEIKLAPESVRSMGVIRLPRTRVELVFRQMTAAEVQGFLARFDDRFRRGGG